MISSNHPITACLVVYQEKEDMLRRALQSVRPLVQDIVMVYDGVCDEVAQRLAKEFGATLEERPHIGIAEPHRSRTFELAKGEWIFQIDADEYLDGSPEVYAEIRRLVANPNVNGYIFQWELWDGKRPFHSQGVQKFCLARRSALQYWGIPQEGLRVGGAVKKTSLFLRHRPLYSNLSWETANRKRDYWLRSHVPYFFPEKVCYETFQDTPENWVLYTKKVRSHPLFFLLVYPVKNFLGQLKNGLFTSWTGWNIALQQYVYYSALYYRIWQEDRRKSHS